MSPKAGRLLVEQIAPRMKATIRGISRVGSEDEEELYQDGLALAAKMLDNAERNGKEVTAGNIAYYAGRQMATGRRSNYAGRMDALSPAAQLDGNARLASLQQEVVRDAESGEEQECSQLLDLLADTAEDPSQAAARNLDWEWFLSGLDRLSRRIVMAFARGESMRDLKSKAGLNESEMSAHKQKLIARMLEVLGPDCLAEAGREPDWRADLTVQHEKDARRFAMAGA